MEAASGACIPASRPASPNQPSCQHRTCSLSSGSAWLQYSRVTIQPDSQDSSQRASPGPPPPASACSDATNKSREALEQAGALDPRAWWEMGGDERGSGHPTPSEAFLSKGGRERRIWQLLLLFWLLSLIPQLTRMPCVFKHSHYARYQTKLVTHTLAHLTLVALLCVGRLYFLPLCGIGGMEGSERACHLPKVSHSS